MSQTTTAKSYYARIVWAGNQQEWVFSCTPQLMSELRQAMLDGRIAVVPTGNMETLINPQHIAKMEFQPAG